MLVQCKRWVGGECGEAEIGFRGCEWLEVFKRPTFSCCRWEIVESRGLSSPIVAVTTANNRRYNQSPVEVPLRTFKHPKRRFPGRLVSGRNLRTPSDLKTSGISTRLLSDRVSGLLRFYAAHNPPLPARPPSLFLEGEAGLPTKLVLRAITAHCRMVNDPGR